MASIRRVCAIALTGTIALLGPALMGGASSITEAAAKGPVLLRDREAGKDLLKPNDPQIQPDTAIEPSLSVNPEDPLNAIAVYQEGRVDGGCAEALGYASTHDGGKTWSYGDLPGLTKATGGTAPLASDAVVAFGPNNTAYANGLICNSGNAGISINVSHNGGKTWDEPIFLDVETFPSNDKNWLIVDNSDAPGHHLGRVYMVWDDIAPVMASYSDDEGQTWTPPSIIYEGQGIGAYPVVQPNGDLVVIFDTLAGGVPLHTEPEGYQDDDLSDTDRMVITVSKGAGMVPTGGPLTFTAPIPVGVDGSKDSRQQRAGEGLPAADVDPKTGRIYVVWADGRFRSHELNDTVITWSDDEGATWSPTKKVNPSAPDAWRDHFTPMIAVGADGSVRIAYRTQKNAEQVSNFSPYVNTYYQQSTDAGATFSKPLKINTVTTDVRLSAFSRASAFLGDYNQMGTAGDLTYIVRCEAFQLHKNEPATFPPKVHHQRAWVAVVDSNTGK